MIMPWSRLRETNFQWSGIIRHLTHTVLHMPQYESSSATRYLRGAAAGGRAPSIGAQAAAHAGAAGLVSGETFATDASVIEADARVARCTEDATPPESWNDPGKVTRPVREYLDQLDKAAGLGALPGESPKPPKSLSLTDPQAAPSSFLSRRSQNTATRENLPSFVASIHAASASCLS